MRKTQLWAILFSVISLTLMLYGTAKGFDENAHKLLSLRAVGTSKLHSFLTGQLQEFLKGIDEVIDGQTVSRHFQDGSVDEDKPVTRVRSHFHDPTKTWDKAGLDLPGFPLFDSSVIWSQKTSLFLANHYSWQDARSAYFAALTNPSEATRKRLYATMFRTLGHVVHLVQDAATPAHSRNDPHPPWDPDYFHTWADSLGLGKGLSAIARSGITAFDLSIFSLPQNDLAPIPIARIMDTEKYRNNPVPSAGTDIGIAEYSHANFFSDDTVRSSYTHPSPSSVDPCTENGRLYLCKVRDGETNEGAGYKLAVASSLANFLPTGFQGAEIDGDDAVMQDYGTLLFPRAIGYSAGLVDYFFRGKIKIEAPERFVYALAKYETGNTGSFKKMRFRVSNDTNYPSATEDTVGPGQMWTVVRYRKPLSGDLIENPFANLSDPFYAVSLPQSVNLTRSAQDLTFDFTGSPIPTNAADIFLMVVWQGKLGLEDGAVLVGGKDLLEPDPLDFGDGSDYDCYKANLYYVADLTQYPPYSSTQTQRDIDSPTDPTKKDGIPDIFGPFTDNDQLIQTYDPQTQSQPIPSATQFNFKVLKHNASQQTGPQFSRFMLLQDRSPYAFSWLVGSHTDVPSGVDTAGDLFTFSFNPIFNDHVVDPAGNRMRRVTTNFKYRGLTTFHIAFFVVGGIERFGSCLSDSFTKLPSFKKVEGEFPPE